MHSLAARLVMYGALLHLALFAVARLAGLATLERALLEPYLSLLGGPAAGSAPWQADGFPLLGAASLTWGVVLAIALTRPPRPRRRISPAG
jgi:hypothetical protein